MRNKRSYIVILILGLLILVEGLLNFNKVLAVNDNAQNEDTQNYSKAYQEYLKLSEFEKSKLNVIPRKYNVPLDTLYENGKKPNALQRLWKAIVGNNESNTLPSSYILTGRDTNNDGEVDDNDIVVDEYGGIKMLVGDQGSEGLCWDFAAMKSLETFLSLHNKYDESGQPFDFSELHVDYLTSELFEGWRFLHGGGDFENFEDYVKNNYGPVWENEVPYESDYSNLDNYRYLSSLSQKVSVFPNDQKDGFVNFPTIDKKNNTYSTAILNEFRKNVKQHITQNGSVYAVISSDEIKEYNRTNGIK